MCRSLLVALLMEDNSPEFSRLDVLVIATRRDDEPLDLYVLVGKVETVLCSLLCCFSLF